MIFRNNANPKGIDLGARRVTSFSDMKSIGGTESTGSGGWDRNMAFLFRMDHVKPDGSIVPRKSKRKAS